MHTLIVTAHPESAALTHAIARRIGEAITATDAANTVTHADLMAEGFDPRFNTHDQALFRGTAQHQPTLPPSRRGWMLPTRWYWSTRCTGGRSPHC